MTATAQDATRPAVMAPTTMPATAPALVDNLQYKMWSKFKPGSSATMAGDINVPGG